MLCCTNNQTFTEFPILYMLFVSIDTMKTVLRGITFARRPLDGQKPIFSIYVFYGIILRFTNTHKDDAIRWVNQIAVRTQDQLSRACYHFVYTKCVPYLIARYIYIYSALSCVRASTHTHIRMMTQ